MAALVTAGTVLTGGTVTLLARIVDWDGRVITPSSVSAIKYTAYRLQNEERVPIQGHTNVDLPVSDVLYSTLVKDAIWIVDKTGYNFRHTINVATNPLATTPGDTVIVALTLYPTAGQVIRWDYMLNVR